MGLTLYFPVTSVFTLVNREGFGLLTKQMFLAIKNDVKIFIYWSGKMLKK